jgi:hypothetical protein
MYGHTMDRTQRISKILNKMNERFHLVFEWLACEDTGRDWDGVGNPYSGNYHKNKKIVGQDPQSNSKGSEIVKNSGRDAESERESS